MTTTPVPAALTVEQWDDRYFMEWVRSNRFKEMMGTDELSMIQIKEQLINKPGDTITIALVNRLKGAGIGEGTTLEGNEEKLDTRSFSVKIGEVANAVRMSKLNEQRSAIELREAAKGALKLWAMENLRTHIITALGSINGVAYATASVSQKNTWLTDNSDRVLFGATLSNTVAGDLATSLANIDTANDRVTSARLKLLKRLAKTCNPKIRPVNVKNDKEYYIVLAGSLLFRDLSEDSAIVNANRDARPRDIDENPIFNGGDLLYDGMIIKEIPEIPTYMGVGAAGSNVAPLYLCGAQALAVAWGMRTKSVTKDFDYDREEGVATKEWRGVAKCIFGTGANDTDDLKDHGVATMFASAVADA